MPLSVVGVKVNNFRIEVKEDGTTEVTGNYALISNKGTVVAKQGFNGYNEVKVDIPIERVKQATKVVEDCIASTIGLEKEV